MVKEGNNVELNAQNEGRDYWKAHVGYIVRFDDFCPEMNWDIWEQVEKILYQYGIKPIIAVIPHSEDQNLNRWNAKLCFWGKIKQYQEDGFMIALHGYNHVYSNHKSGIMGISANSEFCGLSPKDQEFKIKEGIKLLMSHDLIVDSFVAPSHSFDKTTLKILKENNIEIISDGHLTYPYTYYGFTWIPCQIWDVFKERKSGLYTVCIHLNNWTEENVQQFKSDIIKFSDYIIEPFSIGHISKLSKIELVKSSYISEKYKVKRIIKRILKKKQ